MRTRVAVATAILLAACSLPAPAATPVARGKSSFKYGTGDGQSMATAVQIRTRNETEGGELIAAWILTNYPGYTVQARDLIVRREHAYDVVTLVGASNTPRRLYFDITSYHRRPGDTALPQPFP
jgi:hypothetical protein